MMSCYLSSRTDTQDWNMGRESVYFEIMHSNWIKEMNEIHDRLLKAEARVKELENES
jgi:hypothetical protein